LHRDVFGATETGLMLMVYLYGLIFIYDQQGRFSIKDMIT